MMTESKQGESKTNGGDGKGTTSTPESAKPTPTLTTLTDVWQNAMQEALKSTLPSLTDDIATLNVAFTIASLEEAVADTLAAVTNTTSDSTSDSTSASTKYTLNDEAKDIVKFISEKFKALPQPEADASAGEMKEGEETSSSASDVDPTLADAFKIVVAKNVKPVLEKLQKVGTDFKTQEETKASEATEEVSYTAKVLTDATTTEDLLSKVFEDANTHLNSLQEDGTITQEQAQTAKNLYTQLTNILDKKVEGALSLEGQATDAGNLTISRVSDLLEFSKLATDNKLGDELAKLRMLDDGDGDADAAAATDGDAAAATDGDAAASTKADAAANKRANAFSARQTQRSILVSSCLPTSVKEQIIQSIVDKEPNYELPTYMQAYADDPTTALTTLQKFASKDLQEEIEVVQSFHSAVMAYKSSLVKLNETIAEANKLQGLELTSFDHKDAALTTLKDHVIERNKPLVTELRKFDLRKNLDELAKSKGKKWKPLLKRSNMSKTEAAQFAETVRDLVLAPAEGEERDVATREDFIWHAKADHINNGSPADGKSTADGGSIWEDRNTVTSHIKELTDCIVQYNDTIAGLARGLKGTIKKLEDQDRSFRDEQGNIQRTGNERSDEVKIAQAPKNVDKFKAALEGHLKSAQVLVKAKVNEKAAKLTANDQQELVLARKQLTESQASVQSLTTQVDESQASVKSLTTQLTESKASAKSLTTQLTESQASVQSLTTQLGTSKASAKSLTTQLGTSEARLKSLTAPLAKRSKAAPAPRAQRPVTGASLFDGGGGSGGGAPKGNKGGNEQPPVNLGGAPAAPQGGGN